MSQRSFLEESMDASHSPSFVPVCERLRCVFEPQMSEPMPTALDRLLQALDDAYVSGQLFGDVAAPCAKRAAARI